MTKIKYYLVDQVQDGRWQQVGHFASRAPAERLQALLPGRSRIIYAYPAFDRAPRLFPSRDAARKKKAAPASRARGVSRRDPAEDKERVWLALQRAAERTGKAEHAAGRYKVARRKGRVVQGYRISEAHQRVIDTMNALGRDEITPEQAMAVLHEYDILKARTSSGR